MARLERPDRKYIPPKGEIPTGVKLPKRKRITTVNDLLARDDVNNILADLEKVKPHITDCIIIYRLKGEEFDHYQITENTSNELIVWMLERVKLNEILNED